MPRRRSSVVRSRGEPLLASFLNHFARHLVGFKRLSQQERHDLAYLIWVADTSRREHKLLHGYMTIHHLELYKRFGRGKFAAINAKLRVFELTPQWWLAQGATTGYRLTPEAAKIKDAYLHEGRHGLSHFIQSNGQRMRTIPEAIAAKDTKGRTQTVWRNQNVIKRIQVDMPRLLLLYDVLDNEYRLLTGSRETADLGSRGIADLFLPDPNVSDVQWHRDALGKFLRLCKTDLAGHGYVQIRYVVGKTGRLFADGVSLQTLPMAIRKIALHGLWDYDIENCHFALFHQLAARSGFAADAVSDYLQHKKDTREGIASRVGISIPLTKQCLIAIMYGAKDILWWGAAIVKAIGKVAAGRLFADAAFAAILADVKAGRPIILEGYPKRRTTLQNAVGMPIRLDEPAEDQLAHVIQGIEVQALRAVQAEYPTDIVLLMHDGWVSRKPLSVQRMEALMLEETGYTLHLSPEERITLPSDFDLELSKTLN